MITRPLSLVGRRELFLFLGASVLYSTSRYVSVGDLATIGRARAVAEIKRVHFGGALAWLLWLGIHIFYLIGFQNRLLVLTQWAYSYATYGRAARLITGRRSDRERVSAL